jgi:hypothetical protein
MTKADVLMFCYCVYSAPLFIDSPICEITYSATCEVIYSPICQIRYYPPHLLNLLLSQLALHSSAAISSPGSLSFARCPLMS